MSLYCYKYLMKQGRRKLSFMVECQLTNVEGMIDMQKKVPKRPQKNITGDRFRQKHQWTLTVEFWWEKGHILVSSWNTSPQNADQLKREKWWIVNGDIQQRPMWPGDQGSRHQWRLEWAEASPCFLMWVAENTASFLGRPCRECITWAYITQTHAGTHPTEGKVRSL